MNCTISVIVSAYMAEETIGETLQALCAQPDAMLDIVVVDDGSTDGTSEVVRGFETQDRRVRLVRLDENLGAYRARAEGVAVSTGTYITFMDSDDLWAEQTMDKLRTALVAHADVDILQFGMNAFSDDPGQEFVAPHLSGTADSALITGYAPFEEFLRRKINFSLCNKLFKRSLWDAAAAQMPDIQREELDDFARIYGIMMQARSLAFVNHKLYWYRQRPGSVSKSTQPSKILGRAYSVARTLDRMREAIFADPALSAYATEFFLFQADVTRQYVVPAFEICFTTLTDDDSAALCATMCDLLGGSSLLRLSRDNPAIEIALRKNGAPAQDAERGLTLIYQANASFPGPALEMLKAFFALPVADTSAVILPCADAPDAAQTLCDMAESLGDVRVADTIETVDIAPERCYLLRDHPCLFFVKEWEKRPPLQGDFATKQVGLMTGDGRKNRAVNQAAGPFAPPDILQNYVETRRTTELGALLVRGDTLAMALRDPNWSRLRKHAQFPTVPAILANSSLHIKTNPLLIEEVRADLRAVRGGTGNASDAKLIAMMQDVQPLVGLIEKNNAEQRLHALIDQDIQHSFGLRFAELGSDPVAMTEMIGKVVSVLGPNRGVGFVFDWLRRSQRRPNLGDPAMMNLLGRVEAIEANQRAEAAKAATVDREAQQRIFNFNTRIERMAKQLQKVQSEISTLAEAAPAAQTDPTALPPDLQERFTQYEIELLSLRQEIEQTGGGDIIWDEFREFRRAQRERNNTYRRQLDQLLGIAPEELPQASEDAS
ncbi:glycosyltransferase family 2 protein [Tropicibacter naphthalenivorans]|uniref:Putative glycosyltransferase EpsH n=1 Tax=Tropicibacter naphthalenivorans TaxID=441103 RepID=A0A0P1GJ91_9RHOB|nr:glycosyltransferase family 2 protein [Tropicibacter naphthalenivorans]CUH82005.1 Putative glycosyltransferase EpsH [Tropicibacter naphthalenivorans]SMD07719.1 Glycosyltransferase involved in cell wall bisynthesis [Tropicibacter naphthalenivorans]